MHGHSEVMTDVEIGILQVMLNLREFDIDKMYPISLVRHYLSEYMSYTDEQFWEAILALKVDEYIILDTGDMALTEDGYRALKRQ